MRALARALGTRPAGGAPGITRPNLARSCPVEIIPGLLALGVAVAVALTGNSLPPLSQGTPGPAQSPTPCAQIVLGNLTPRWSCGDQLPLQVRPHCDAPWTFAVMDDGVWQCAGSPGPVVLP
jgi:hypothetical protein